MQSLNPGIGLSRRAPLAIRQAALRCAEQALQPTRVHLQSIPRCRRGAGGEVLDVTPTKLLIGQILIVFAIVALGLWAATEWAASMLAYQRELGSSWFTLGELPVYRPWALFRWW